MKLEQLNCSVYSCLIQKSHNHLMGRLYDSPFRLFSDISINTFCSRSRTNLHSLHTALLEVLGWVWMDKRVLHFPNTLYNKSLLIMPKEYKINILNNKPKNKTVLQRTS